MKPAPRPVNEKARLKALFRYKVLDTPAEDVFDELTRLAADLCNTPVAAITLIDEDREWYKSKIGIEDKQAPRNISFCAHTILQDDLMIVPDTFKDERFSDNPFVLEDPPLRFYAGAPLLTPDGHAVGTLCVIDHVPRRLTDNQKRILNTLASHVVTQLELKYVNAEHKKVGAAYADSENRYKYLVERMNDGLIILDEDNIITYVNNRSCEMSGYSSQELVGKPVAMILDEKNQEILKEQVNKRKKGIVNSYELGFIHKDGYKVHTIISPQPIFDKSDKYKGSFAIVTDISARRQAEEELIKEKDRAQKYLDIADVILITLDREGKVSLINNKGCDLLGYAEDEIIGQDWFQCFVPDNIRDEVKSGFEKLTGGDEITLQRYENPVRTRYGKELIIAWHNSVLHDKAGNIIGTLSSGEDITERKRTEEALKSSHKELEKRVEERTAELSEMYMALSNAMPGIAKLDTLGRYITVNKMYAELLGYEPEGLIGHDWYPTVHPDDHPIALAAYEQMQRVGKSEFEARAVRRDGTEFYKQVLMVRITDESGEFTGHHCFMRDISERKNFEINLRKSEEKFASAIKASPDAICITRICDGKILEVNNGFTRISGYTKEEVINKSTLELPIWANPEHRNLFLEKLKKTGLIIEEELEFIRKNGQHFYVLMSAIAQEINGEQCLFSISRDITERKQAEEALRFASFTIDHAADCIYWIKPDASFFYVNEAACKELGYTRAELLTMHVYDIDPLVTREIWQEHWEIIRAKKYLHIESQHRTKDGRIIEIDVQANYLAFEGKEYNCAIVRDITERKRIENNLKLSEEKFHKAFHNCPDAVTISTLDEGRFLEVSDNMELLTGYSRDELIGLSAFELNIWVNTADRIELIKRLQADGTVSYFETDLRARNGEIRRVQLSADIIMIAGKEYMLTVAKDITLQKLAEEALVESENKFSTAFMSSPDAIIITSIETARIIDVNQGFEKLSGHSREDVVGKTTLEISGYKDIKDRDEIIRKLASDGAIHDYEVEFLNKTGETRYCQVSAKLINLNKEQCAISIIRDIHELKTAEKALQESEQRFKSSFEYAPIGKALVARDHSIIQANQAMCNMLGYTREELIGTRFKDITHPDDINTSIIKHQELVAGEINIYHIEKKYLHKDGHIIWALLSVSPVRDYQNNFLYAIAQIQDITERKQAEQELRFARFATDRAADCIYWITPDSHFSYVNDAACAELGYSREVLLSMRVIDINPAYTKEIWGKIWDKLRHEKVSFYETYHRTKDGYIFPVEVRANFIEFEGKEYDCAIVRNITERKQTEAALIKSEEKYRSIIETTSEWIWEIDLEGNHTYSNIAVEHILGYKLEEFVKLDAYSLIHEQERESIKLLIEKSVKNKKGWKGLVIRWCHKNGGYRHLESNAVPILDNNGEVIAFRGSDRDITERKAAEEKLAINNQIVKASSDFMAFVDRNYIYQQINDTYCRVFNKPRNEIIGHTMAEVFGDEFFNEVQKNHVDECLTGKHVHFESFVNLPGLSSHYYDVHFNPVYTDAGAITGVAINARDITDRKKAIEELNIYNRIVDSSSDIGSFIDRDYKYLAVNNAYTKLFNKPKEEIIGKRIADLFGKEVFENIIKPRLDECLTGKHVAYELYAEFPGSGFRYMDVHYDPSYSSDGIINGIAVNTRDITDRKMEQKKLDRYMRAFRVLSKCNEAVTRINDENTLLEQVCQIAVEEGGYRFAWIGYPQYDRMKTIKPVAHKGFEVGYLKNRITWNAKDKRGQGPTGTAIRTKHLVVIRNIADDPIFQPWREPAMKRGYASSVALPLVINNEAIGALRIYASEKNAFDEAEVKLLMELADNLALGVHSLRIAKSLEKSRKETEYAKQILLLEKNILETVNTEKSLDETINNALNSIEQIYPEMICSIVFLDETGEQLRDSYGPSLPEQYHKMIYGLPVGPKAGSCGTAVFRKERVIVSDILKNPLWENYRQIAHTFNLRACWSTPIFCSDGRIICTFANYYRKVKSPSTEELQVIDQLSHILGVSLERLITELEFKKLSKQNALLLQAAGEGIYGLDINGNTTFINPAATAILGWEVEELIGQSMHEILHYKNADGLPYPLEDCPIHSSIRDGTINIITDDIFWKKDGTAFPVEYTSTPIHDEKNNVTGAVVVFKDITERRQAEQALERNKEHLRFLYEENPSMYFTIAPDGTVLSLNEFGASELGYVVDELTGKSVLKIFPEYEHEKVKSHIQVCLKNFGQLQEWEIEKVRKSGEKLWVKETARAVGTPDGKTAVLIVCRDITERKQAEARLKRNHELSQSLVQLQSEFISSAQPREHFDKLLGMLLSVTESEYGFIGEVLHTEKGDPYLKIYAINNVAWDGETRRFYNENASAGLEFHNLNTLFGAVMTTGEIVISNDSANDPRAGGTLYGHPPLSAFMGMPLYVGKTMIGMTGVANRPRGYDQNFALEIQPLLYTCANVMEGFRNQEKRKTIEAELRKSEASLAEAQRVSHQGSWEIDHINNKVIWSNETYRIFKVSQEQFEVTYESFIGLIHPEDRNAVDKAFKDSLRNKNVFDITHRVKMENGGIKYINERCETIYDSHNQPLHSIGTASDITKIKLAEMKLQVNARQQAFIAELGRSAISNIELTKLFDIATQGLAKELDVEYTKILEFLGDKNELLLRSGVGWKDGLVNHATVSTDMKSQAGYTLIKNKPVIVTDLSRETRFTGPQLLIDHGVISGVSVVIDGREKPYGVLGVHTVKHRVFTEDEIILIQTLANVLAAAIDRNRVNNQIFYSRERFRKLAERLQVVREEERTMVAREIHDELGQTLTGIKIDLSWLREHLPRNWKKIPERLESMISLVDSKVETTRNMALRLRPAMLDDLGLEAAIDWEVQEFAKRLGCKYSLELKNGSIKKDRNRDTTVFRILQEAMTNIARHANAKHIDIKLNTSETYLVLTVKDDGIGISPVLIKSSNSLGLIGMHERALAMGGYVEITPIKKGGTQVMLKLPLVEYQHD